MNSKLISVQETADLIKNWDNILILCHKNPDGDTLGSRAALANVFRQMGKRCRVACHNRIPVKYDYLTLPVYAGDFEIEHIIAVDLAGENLFGDNLKEYLGKTELCIDHHETNGRYSKFLCLKGHYPAACQIIYEIILRMGEQITVETADALYTGIITDTGCFRFSNTMPETHVVASHLMELGAHYVELSERFFMSKSRKTVELEKYALNNLEYYFDGRCAILVLDKDTLDSIKPDPTDLDGLSSLAKNFEGVDVSILLRWIGENRFKGSVRTSEAANAVNIASPLGGGGHNRARGFELDHDLEAAKLMALAAAGEELCGQKEPE